MNDAALLAERTTTGGTIPEGIWVLDQARSRKLTPTSHSLWIIRDDGTRLIWASVETTDAGTQVTAYDNGYDAGPAVVTGSGFVAQITSPRPGVLVTTGEVPGMGAFTETSNVLVDGKTMQCHGEVHTADGTLTWFEHFDWTGPSPHPALIGA